MTDDTHMDDEGEGDLFPDPDRLLAELRRLGAVADPVPAVVVDGGDAAFTWRTVDAELAELVFDSALEPAAAVRTTEATGRLLSFGGAGLTVDVEAVATAGGVRLLGQLDPPGARSVEVRHRGGVVEVQVDDLGRFRADGVPPGAFSFRCRYGDRVVDTAWTLL